MIYLRNTTESQKIYIERQSIQTADTREINYITSGDVINIVDAKLEPYSTTEEVEGMISSAISGTVTEEQMNQAIQSAKTEIEAEIPSLDGYATEEWVQEQGYLTEHQSLSAYSTTEQMNTAIDNAVSGKQDTLISGTNIKTINGESILGEGNVEVITDLSDYWTSAETNSAIENAIASESARCESTYLKEHQSLSAYSTTVQVEGMISSATSGMATEEWVQEQGYITEHQELSGLFADVQYVSVDKKIYFYDKNNTLVGQVDTTDFIKDGMVDNVYISGETLYIVFNTDAGKETIELDLTDIFDASNYYTKTEVDNLIADFVTSGDVKTQFSNLVIDWNLASKGYVNNAVKNFVTSAQVETQITNKNYITSADAETQINTALEDYYTSADTDTKIEEAIATESARCETTYLKEHQSLSAYSTTEQMNTAIDNAVSGKQDVLVSGTNIKTINNQSILGSGNIEIQGGGSYSAGTNIDITDNVISVTGIVIPDVSEFVTSADVKTQFSNLVIDWNLVSKGYVNNAVKNFVTSAQVETQITNKNYITSANAETQINTALEDYYTSADTDTKIEEAIATESARCETTYLKEHQSLSAYSTTEQMNTAIDSAVGAESARTDTAIASESARCESTYLKEHQSLDNYYTSAETNTAINTALEGYYTSAQTDNLLDGKQETLVSGTNIKTINNQSILGSGNIVIQGGSGGSTNVIELTKAEYDALTSYTEDAIYVITDAETVNLNDFATSADVQTLSGDVQSVETALNNKADKVTVTANSGLRFPAWNTQGIITGTTGSTAYQRSLSINGTSKTMLQTTNSDFTGIYAPTSAGSAGQPLLSAGSGAPTWATFKFWYGTQSQYDAIITKDNNTIYFVKDD